MKNVTLETGKTPTPEMIEEITLGGQSVKLIHKDIPIEDVNLDRTNQRLQYFIAAAGASAKDEDLEKRLWEIPDVKALYRSILGNLGLIERIIVKHDGTVVEGNCRTVCYRKLHRDQPDEPRWMKIPARTLPAGIDQKLLAILLGEMHVAGKNAWTAYERAAYVYRMHENLGFSLDWLAEHLRASKSSITKDLKAYKLMAEEFLVRYPDPSNLYKFSYFQELYKKIKKPESEIEDEFVNWVGTGKLNEGIQVRDLPSILKHSAAKKALGESGYSAAMRVLEAVDPSYTSKFFEAVDEMIEEFKKAPAEDIQAIQEGDQARIDKVKNLYKAIRDFARLADLNLNEKPQ